MATNLELSSTLHFIIEFQIGLQMGSLGPVKLLKEKKPAELAKNLLEDISNKSLKMGNLCSVGASGAAKQVSTTLNSHVNLQ